jgi:hypothetical protein
VKSSIILPNYIFPPVYHKRKSNLKYAIMKFISAIAIVALLADAASAYTVSSSVSAFGGSVLVTGTAPSTQVGPSIEMRKGKDNVPPAMRAQYKKQKEMQGMREQMMEAQQPGADGLPVFNLFVRTPRANVRSNMSTFVKII